MNEPAVSISTALSLVDTIAAGAQSVPEFWLERMHNSFRYGAGLDPEASVGSIDSWRCLDGLTHAVHSGMCGIWLDHSESHLLASRARDLVEICVGVPDPSEAVGYEPFTMTHDNLALGLFELDQWLEWAHQWWRAREGLDQQTADARDKHLRLIEVNRGDDTVLSIAHPLRHRSDLIERLQQLGITARPQTTGTNW